MEDSSNSTCFSGVQAIPLSSGDSCQPGFYCPATSAHDPPAFCLPSLDCLLTRLQSGGENLCASAQGKFEPVICNAGFYCPAGGKQKIQCPRGHFCPLGTVAPFPCSVMSICPAGSTYQTPLLGFFLCFLLDCLMIGMCVASRTQSSLRQMMQPLRLTHLHPQSRTGESEAQAVVSRLELRDFFNPELVPDGGLVLSFTSIDLHPRRSPRKVLSGLNGAVHCGSVLGIIGASGSGKSSFVNILSGRIRPTEGWVSINGQRSEPKQLRDLIGLIPQHDALLPDATVRENIIYSGRVLLGGRLSERQIQEYVDFLISSLGLEDIRHQLVGGLINEGGQGISGGEYKRVSIAVSLAAAPLALILDEPTSGLDATAAHSLMKLLHSISRQGIIVVCVIHQPRVEIFRLLDDLLVLNGGAQVYLGKAADAQPFFEKVDQRFPAASNPADVILDILSNGFPTPGEEKYPAQESIRQNPSPGTGMTEEALATLLRTVTQRRASWTRQLWLAFSRGTTQQCRQTTSLALEIVSSAVTGLMIGLAAFESRGHFFQGIYHDSYGFLSSAVEYRLIAEQGLLCCLAIACAAGPPSVKIFGEEKVTFYREAQSGHSRSAYFIGKSLAVSFRMLVAALHFTSFYMVLAAPMISFALQLGLALLYFYCIYGLGFVVSAVTRREDGPLLCMLLSLIISALSGCAPRLSTVRSWHLEWFWYSWPATWFSEAFYQENTAPLAYLYNVNDAATFTGYRIGRTTVDLCALLLIGTLYRAVSYVLFIFWGWGSQR
ncbi:hypothetical protein BDV38DRAFT_290517 [Aspergillus pseudotamarii]|uniref:ABC transporter domain-containing protein n=1 Tax=Aspergillus pseudotamarii TaxID=132259 RepID=A0A5N6T1W9_ASPPS|nr:uncharacterized protein BDV38DRAFT_290517 [Aspergillus pseudotamarii]KAE8140279.1 hypothetical protein BDV38DRAFT_290517 [Aspergillus pseudotamarii]